MPTCSPRRSRERNALLRRTGAARACPARASTRIAPARRALASAVTALVALLSACSGDQSTAPAVGVLDIVTGDAQHTSPNRTLGELLTVRLHDRHGAPIAGRTVTWTAAAGTIVPDAPATDANGVASARWTPGLVPGQYTAVASAEHAPVALFRAWVDSPPRADAHALAIATYDGSGQSVHPDIVTVPVSWNGTPDRLLLTPYPEGNPSFENPSLYASGDGETWIVPDGIVNPLVAPATGYLSDPDALFDPETDELLVYYRQVTSENEIWLIRSSDGAHWSTPALIVHAPNHQIVSPTVVRRGQGNWLMWAVDAGDLGCTSALTTVTLRRSTDGEHWSAPEPVQLGQPVGFAWHLDVEWIPSRHEFWALFPVKQPGSCTTAALYLATSPDGVHWTTFPSPVLGRGAIPEFRDIVYRSTFAYDDASGTLTLWYSGARFADTGYSWHVAREQISADALIARASASTVAASVVQSPSAASTASGHAPVRQPRAAPPLTNATAP